MIYNDYGYDLETYPNIFTMAVKRVSDGACRVFEISERVNESHEIIGFMKYLMNSNSRMVGFNNIGFDYPVLHTLCMAGYADSYMLYKKAQSIIDSDRGFGHQVWDSETLVPQIDLYKIWHYDNVSKSTSLKMLEFNMRSPNIIDLPYKPGSMLTYPEMDNLKVYNVNDVDETLKFMEHSRPMIEFRETLSAKYNRNFMNHNDTKIGKDYFMMELGINNKNMKQTPRPHMRLGAAVLSSVVFKTRPFQLVREWLINKDITKTKGVFESIEVSAEMASFMDPSMIKVHDLTEEMAPSATTFQRKKGVKLTSLDINLLKNQPVRFISGLKDKSGLNCTVDGFNYVFGTGGIHGSIESTTVESDDDHIIIDLDVASYYPNLAIANRLYPEHLGEQFCDIYLDVYNQRKSHKKGTPENAMLKLALNGVYGDSNNQYSPFYDPLYTMRITINGQLLLCMLAEWLRVIPDLQMIQINTDGLTVRIPRVHEKMVADIAKQWEDYTKLELESVKYSRMFIRDVNNYIGEYEDGKLKRKGAYEYELDWHQNHSSIVVAKAAEAALVRNADIESFVKNHDNLFDFMLRTKVPRSSSLVLNDGFSDIEELQRITRYYISKPTVPGITQQLVKIMPPLKENPEKFRRIGISVGWNVTECNDITQARGDVDYDYYINEVKKLVDPLR